MRRRMVETMVLPENAVESAASYFWMNEQGILMVLLKPKTQHNIEDALDGIRITLQLSGGIPRPMHIDLTQITSISREAREAYAQAGTHGNIKAVGLVTKSALGRIAANFFLGFNKPEVPVRVFNSHVSADIWLAGFI